MKQSLFKALSLVLLLGCLTACDITSSGDKEGAQTDSVTVDNKSVEAMITQINEMKKEVMASTTVEEYIKIENDGNKKMMEFFSSEAPLNDDNREKLVDAIVTYSHDSYLHLQDLENKVMFDKDMQALQDMMENVKLDFSIKAQKAATLGEFLQSCYNNH